MIEEIQQLVLKYTEHFKTKIPTEPKLPQTGDNMNLFFYMGIGALALITGLGAGLSRRKKCEWKYFFKRYEIALDHTLLNRVWYK